MINIETWAIEYVSRIDASFSRLQEEEKLVESLFTSGRLDSMALMNLFLDAEIQFGFMFTPESFQDRRLHTISGLGEVIRELSSAT